MNEIIFFATALINLLFVFLAWQTNGKKGLYGIVLIDILLVSIFGGKIISLGIFETNATNAFYAILFVAVNIILEVYGRREGYKLLKNSFLLLILFILLSQFIIRFEPVSSSVVSQALSNIFDQAPRLSFASLFAYIIAFVVGIELFIFLKNKMSGRKLWLRVIVVSIVVQFIDSILFFTIAFLATVPNTVLFSILFTGFCAKVFISIISIPVIYLCRAIKPAADED